MSRIGKKPVSVPSGVKIQLQKRHLEISSSSAVLKLDIHPAIQVEYHQEAGQIQVSRQKDARQDRALHGTTRALIANMVEGVTKGFQRKMQIFGAGYGVKQQGKDLLLTVGFAKPASVEIPDVVKVNIETPNTRGNDTPAAFTVESPDKAALGQFAAEVRKVRPPEPYLGKGIRYADEVIRRKEGKAFASGG